MKVFFLSTPRGLKELGDNYKWIYESITKLGYENVSNFIVGVEADAFYKGEEQDRVKHYKQMVDDVKKADVVVFETSLHSLAVGHMVNLALGMGKPVVALYVTGKMPYFLSGVVDEKLQLAEYSKDTIKDVLGDTLAYATEQADTRFNFFVSPSIVNYLDWVSKKMRVPRAVYLRKLIEDEMRKNAEYNESK
jgi:hypothetical protein